MVMIVLNEDENLQVEHQEKRSFYNCSARLLLKKFKNISITYENGV